MCVKHERGIKRTRRKIFTWKGVKRRLKIERLRALPPSLEEKRKNGFSFISHLNLSSFVFDVRRAGPSDGIMKA